MKKPFIPLILTSIIFCTVAFSLPDKSKKIIVSYESWPPSTMLITKNNKQRGFVIDMMTDIFAEKGYELEFVNYPYARSIVELKKGNIHILAETVEGTPKTEQLLFPKEPTFRYRHAFFIAKKNNWSYSGLESLKKLKRIATIPGYQYAVIDKNFANYLEDKETTNVTVISGNDAVDRVFKLIAIGRIDAFCEAYIVGQHVINTYHLADQVKSSTFLDTNVIEKPAFSPNDSRAKELMRIWDEGRKRLTHKDKIRDYLKKYNISVTDF